MDKTTKPTDLDLMREPFPANQISKLPKPTKAQTDAVKADFKSGTRCEICGGWHHPKVVHLDYVGHAALTDRLLDCDIAWGWEPLALNPAGTPVIDGNGGMWIKLTVCGITRLGYGHADGKQGGDAVKEAIGDALRNAAMRFGAALDLWHKGDLHSDGDDPKMVVTPTDNSKTEPNEPQFNHAAARDRIKALIAEQIDVGGVEAIYRLEVDTIAKIKAAAPPMELEIMAAFKAKKSALQGMPI